VTAPFYPQYALLSTLSPVPGDSWPVIMISHIDYIIQGDPNNPFKKGVSQKRIALMQQEICILDICRPRVFESKN